MPRIQSLRNSVPHCHAEAFVRHVVRSSVPLSPSKPRVPGHRPFACRTHLSLDDDDLLCRLDRDVEVPMPRFDTRLLVGIFLGAQPRAVVADIREFFGPAGSGPAGTALREHE